MFISAVGGTKDQVCSIWIFSISVDTALFQPGCFIASAMFLGRPVGFFEATKAYLILGLWTPALLLVCILCWFPIWAFSSGGSTATWMGGCGASSSLSEGIIGASGASIWTWWVGGAVKNRVICSGSLGTSTEVVANCQALSKLVSYLGTKCL